jgi:hypothetical protein
MVVLNRVRACEISKLFCCFVGLPAWQAGWQLLRQNA